MFTICRRKRELRDRRRGGRGHELISAEALAAIEATFREVSEASRRPDGKGSHLVHTAGQRARSAERRRGPGYSEDVIIGPLRSSLAPS
jgi:hypothetical protein